MGKWVGGIFCLPTWPPQYKCMEIFRTLNYLNSGICQHIDLKLAENFWNGIIYIVWNFCQKIVNLKFDDVIAHQEYCYYLEFLTKMNCLYFQPIMLKLRRYHGGYLWNRMLWRLFVYLIKHLPLQLALQLSLVRLEKFCFHFHFVQKSKMTV